MNIINLKTKLKISGWTVKQKKIIILQLWTLQEIQGRRSYVKIGEFSQLGLGPESVHVLLFIIGYRFGLREHFASGAVEYGIIFGKRRRVKVELCAVTLAAWRAATGVYGPRMAPSIPTSLAVSGVVIDIRTVLFLTNIFKSNLWSLT